ncbi:hypothetical protein BbiDN127_D0015 (plasmid) [Borreliella bissettiae DN127]|uniref:Uncharacterized protein n=1 Tax=Borrelia bissettiae (strain DSM 17990 / CIP 109136 / DN127) TaxID=521010 RepID=G0ANZ1_BORBD|nr:hypothetical protein BbiDN127_D0015 [Borreliella bissettiae DN127]
MDWFVFIKKCERCALGIFYGLKKIKYDEFCSDFIFVKIL